MSDLISRQAAIDKFEPWLKVEGYSEGELNMLRAVLYELRFLPSAQRKGNWIAERYMDEVDSCFYTRYKCSECGRIVYDSSLPYCHCGAEMERRGR